MPNCAQNATIYSILKKTERYIDPVRDISTSKGYFHCILHVECYARQFHRRVKQTCAKNASICSILKKTERYFACVGDISTFKCSFHRTLHAECYARQIHRRMNQTFTKNAIMYSILKKTVRYIAPVGIISTFKLYFQCILHTDSYARRI